MKFVKTQAGFTLIELLLYIAIVSIFLSGAILFGWDIIYGQVRSSVQREVAYNLRLASKRISYELRNSSAVNSVSSTSICVASADTTHNPTRIYQSGTELRIAWGGGSSDCTSMTNDQPLIDTGLQVTSFSFTDLSTTGSNHIQFEVTVAFAGDRPEWNFSETYQSSIEVRTP